MEFTLTTRLLDVMDTKVIVRQVLMVTASAI